MLAPAGDLPAFARIEDGGVVRVLPDSARHRASLACSWGNLRAIQIHAEPEEVGEGHILTHAVTLNLGSEMTSESNYEGRGWQTHRTPHLGIGVFPAHVPYALREHDTRDLFIVEMVPEFVTSALGETAANKELQPVIGAQDAFAKYVLLALAEEARTGAPSGILRAESLGTALVAHLVERDYGPPAPPEPALPSQKLRRVLDYVAMHLDAPLTLRTLAGLVDMDQFRFIRAFKQTTGLSPHRYVLEARINKAKDLLRNRALSITDIALETGFATPSHFSVTFRRIVNATPRAYRDSLR